jgi:hypothetical protein
VLRGNAQDNTIEGLDGNDTIDGKEGIKLFLIKVTILYLVAMDIIQ